MNELMQSACSRSFSRADEAGAVGESVMRFSFLRNRLLAVAAALLLVGAQAALADVPSPAAPVATPDPAVTYHIGAGDILHVFVWNHPELTVDVPVRPDGMVSTPLVENVPAAGKTPTELARTLEQSLSEYVRAPKVNVIVTGFVGAVSDQIRVVGQAAKPQSLPFKAGMTVLDVVIAVGGLGEFAAGNRSQIVRREGTKETRIKVRVADIVNKGDLRTNVAMHPGDVLIIPESRF